VEGFSTAGIRTTERTTEMSEIELHGTITSTTSDSSDQTPADVQTPRRVIKLNRFTGSTLYIATDSIQAITDLSSMAGSEGNTIVHMASGDDLTVTDSAKSILDMLDYEPVNF
jgi:hypothetical protein